VVEEVEVITPVVEVAVARDVDVRTYLARLLELYWDLYLVQFFSSVVAVVLSKHFKMYLQRTNVATQSIF
jgi:hypothetical protein